MERGKEVKADREWAVWRYLKKELITSWWEVGGERWRHGRREEKRKIMTGGGKRGTRKEKSRRKKRHKERGREKRGRKGEKRKVERRTC